MKGCLARLGIGLGALALTAAAVGVLPAGAVVPTVVSCGQTITQDTILAGNVGPCANDGIRVGADNITLDLNGFTVFGTANNGDGAGVLLAGRTGVTVQRGTVTEFDGGVVILGGTRNTVRQIVATKNIGKSPGHALPATTLYGDGILVQGSTYNTIVSNVADNNGPFSGIGLIPGDPDHPAIAPAPVYGNVVQGNSVTNNVACRVGPFCDNDGIRVEPGAGGTCPATGTAICPGPGNQIIDNSVTGNGLDGIALFGRATNNFVQSNTVNSNGFQGAVLGDGIRVFGANNVVQNNSVNQNGAGGVSVGRRPPSVGSFPASPPNGRTNRLLANTARGNGVDDLWDSNPGCDNNIWSRNVGVTAQPACTLNP